MNKQILFLWQKCLLRQPLLFGIYNLLFCCKSFFPGFLEAGCNAIFIDGTDSFCGNFQGDPFIFFRNEKPFCVKIGEESPECLMVGVGNSVSFDGLFPGDFADSCHGSEFNRLFFKNGVQRTVFFLN